VLPVSEILGDQTEPQFKGRFIERLRLDSMEATKRILRRNTDAGTDVAISLPRGSYLADGAVLADDGVRIVVIERAPEPALVVSFALELDRARVIEAATRIGHAFGNQHVPVEIVGHEVCVPITTSAELARRTVDLLDLPGVYAELAEIPLGRRRRLQIG